MKFVEKLIINLCLIIFTLSASYFLIGYISIQRDDRINLQICLAEAHEEYRNQWSFQCLQNKKPKDCESLPGITSNQLIEDLKERKLACAKLFR
jgi:hypothetical protein